MSAPQYTKEEIQAAFTELDAALANLDDTVRMPEVDVHGILQCELSRLETTCAVQQVSIMMFEKMLIAVAELHPETISTIQRLTAIANEVINNHTSEKETR